MRIRVVGIPIADQPSALDSYTGALGFVAGMDMPMGEYRSSAVSGPHETERTPD